MTAYAGCDGIFSVGPTPTVLGEVKDWSIEETGDALETSIIGDKARRYIGGMTGWAGSATLNWDDDDAGQALVVVGTVIEVQLEPTGADAGDWQYTGSMVVTGVSSTASFDGVIEKSVTFQGTGALNKATIV